MKRAECIGMLYSELEDKVVVTIMGACAQELYDLGHRENFFYLQHAMGLASSVGLGLALHLPHEKIVVLDGDGSVLMNLGTLATLAGIGRATSCMSFSTTAACSRPADSIHTRRRESRISPPSREGQASSTSPQSIQYWRSEKPRSTRSHATISA